MKIRSNVTPTPIVSTVAQAATSDNQPAAGTPVPPPRGAAEPVYIDLGEKQIELQPGELARVVDKLNETARVFNHSLQFQVAAGKQIVIRVVDTVSGQVVREIPPEKAVDALSRVEAALGLLLDLKV